MAHDPARSIPRTLAEHVKIAQDACKQVPCMKAREHRLNCPFCPWMAKYLKSIKEGV